MQAFLSIRFQLDDKDKEEITQAQRTLVRLRDAITKTGEAQEAKDKINEVIVLMTDIVTGHDIC